MKKQTPGFRKQLFREHVTDGSEDSVPAINMSKHDELGQTLGSGLQHSPVLRPVQRSPGSNFSSAEASLDGSYVGNIPAAENDSTRNMRSPVQSVERDHLNIQNYVLQNNVVDESRDANASGASQNHLDIPASNHSVARTSNELSQHEISQADVNPITANRRGNYRNSDLDEGDHVSESEHAEADQYLELEQESVASEHFQQLHEEDDDDEADFGYDESNERCEPEGQYQGNYDRKLLGAQTYGPNQQVLTQTNSANMQGQYQRKPTYSSHNFAAVNSSLPVNVMASISATAVQPEQRRAVVYDGQASDEPHRAIAYDRQASDEPRRAMMYDGQAADKHEPIRQWVLNVDPNPNPEDDQYPYDQYFDQDQMMTSAMCREPTQGATDDRISPVNAGQAVAAAQSAPTVPLNGSGDHMNFQLQHPARQQQLITVHHHQQARAKAPSQSLSLQAQSHDVESEQTESYAEQSTDSVMAATARLSTESALAMGEPRATVAAQSVARDASHVESDGSQASVRSASRMSSSSRQDTEGASSVKNDYSLPPAAAADGAPPLQLQAAAAQASTSKGEHSHNLNQPAAKETKEVRLNPQGKGAVPKQGGSRATADSSGSSRTAAPKKPQRQASASSQNLGASENTHARCQQMTLAGTRQGLALSGIKTTKTSGSTHRPIQGRSVTVKSRPLGQLQRGQPSGSDPRSAVGSGAAGLKTAATARRGKQHSPSASPGDRSPLTQGRGPVKESSKSPGLLSTLFSL